MSKYNYIVIFLLLAGFTVFSGRASAQTITFGANESPPYWSKKLSDDGMCGEIIHAISREVGLESVIEFMPLKRLIEDDTNNDLGNPDFYMKTQDFAAIVPIAMQNTKFIYYRPNHKNSVSVTLEALKKYKIGVLKGTLADRTYFEDSGIRFETSYSQDSLIKKMKLGRIDLSLGIDLIAQASIARLFPDEVKEFAFVDIAGSVTPIAILIAESHPNANAIGDRLRLGLDNIIENGRYQQILEKYYGAGAIPDDWFEQLAKFKQLYTY